MNHRPPERLREQLSRPPAGLAVFALQRQRLCKNSAVPPGLISFVALFPSAEALGYSRPPLRGYRCFCLSPCLFFTPLIDGISIGNRDIQAVEHCRVPCLR